MRLVFDKSEIDFAKSLSAVVRVGDDLWVGGDEGTQAFGLRTTDKETFIPEHRINLVTALDLPGTKPDKDGQLPEVDLEGMDWDEKSGYLWVVGSHSLKRKAAKKDLGAEDNIKRLKDISADGNRFLLGRLALQLKGGKSQPLSPGAYTNSHFPARIECSILTSALLDSLREDKLFKPFLDGGGIPGKDNGVDIEGLAWDGKNERLFVGMRGPVLRGMAVILELKTTEEFRGPDKEGRLILNPIGSGGRLYRRHFLDLGGLSVRDLCFHGDDLLILAGPTMPIEWPITIFRWLDARGKMNGKECFAWQAADDLVVHAPEDLPQGKGDGRPEGMGLWDKDRLFVVHDAPSGSHFTDPATTILDEVAAGRQPSTASAVG